MNTVRRFMRDHYIEILLCLAGFALLFLLLWFRLGSLTFGNAAAVEVTSKQAALSWHSIIDNPLNAPHSVVQRLVMYTGHSGITSMRLVSTVWAVIAIVLFYIVARQWHSARVAGLATWLFISSAWFLHTARLATPEILWLVSVLALVVLFTPRRQGFDNRLVLPVTLIVLCVSLYVPGMVWLVLASIIVQRGNVAQAWAATGSYLGRGLSLLLGAAILTPLVYALFQTPSLLRAWAGIGPVLGQPLDIAMRFLAVPKQLFVAGPADPVYWLGRLPLLSVFETLMLVVGVYFYVRHFGAARARFILILSGIAWLVYAIGGLTSLSLIIPAVYLFVATGIAYMLRQWLQVFPQNPIARALGIAVIVTAVLLTSIYQTRSYFVAWRYSPETINVFNQKL